VQSGRRRCGTGDSIPGFQGPKVGESGMCAEVMEA
jgi:hypothetical protein